MIGVLIILSLTSTALSKKYYLDNGFRSFSKIPSNQTNIFYTKGKPGRSFAFTLTMKKMNETPFNYLYYDKWDDYYDNPTFSSYIDVKSHSTISDNITIYHSFSSASNYVGIKFTPDYDLENVNIAFGFNTNDMEDLFDGISELISSSFSFSNFLLL